MEPTRVCAAFWSPTGNSRKTAEQIAEALAALLHCPMESCDLIPALPGGLRFSESDLVVFGLPTYAGRLPNKLLPLLRTQIEGGGATAVATVSFGGRGFDNALAELCAVLRAAACSVVAAGAFVGRHAFTNKLAFGRPDAADRLEMKRFAARIADKLARGDTAPVPVPGDPTAPYYVPLGTDGKPAAFLKAKPQTDLMRCNRCGACARICPMGAIDPADPARVPGTCIKCQRCIRRCTRHARFFDDPAFLSHVAMLETTCHDAAENQLFL